MKKTVKVLFGIAAAGAVASAAALVTKKRRNRSDDFVFEEDDPFEDDDFEDDYYLGMRDGDTSLDKEETDFVRYILDGISNVAYLMNSKFEDIERICRRRNIASAEKMEQISAICQAGKENYDLIGGCVVDIKDIIDGKYPDDYWEFHFEQHKEEEDDKDAE